MVCGYTYVYQHISKSIVLLSIDLLFLNFTINLEHLVLPKSEYAYVYNHKLCSISQQHDASKSDVN